MEKTNTPVTVNVINRNYPPYVGITGESAYELVEYLLHQGFIVNVIHIDANYGGGGNKSKPLGNIYRIKTFYNGKNKLFRLFSNLIEGYLLIKKAKKLPAAVSIVMSDPPLLNMWAALLFRYKYKWIWWSMDLYPEAFVSGNLVSENNLLYKWIEKILKKYKPHHIIALGPCQAGYLKQKFASALSFTNLPCGIFQKAVETNVPAWKKDNSKIYLGYCGNLGEAHAEEFLYAVIDQLDPERYELILSVYGSKAKKLLEYATGKPGITITASVSRSELSSIDVHLACLKSEWVNVCVPSKTVSSICAGAAFVYYGYAHSDNWILLKKGGWIISPGNNLCEVVGHFLSTLDYVQILEKKRVAVDLALSLNQEKQHAFKQIAAVISKTTNLAPA